MNHFTHQSVDRTSRGWSHGDPETASALTRAEVGVGSVRSPFHHTLHCSFHSFGGTAAQQGGAEYGVGGRGGSAPSGCDNPRSTFDLRWKDNDACKTELVIECKVCCSGVSPTCEASKHLAPDAIAGAPCLESLHPRVETPGEFPGVVGKSLTCGLTWFRSMRVGEGTPALMRASMLGLQLKG